jgi:hypothetical protein
VKWDSFYSFFDQQRSEKPGMEETRRSTTISEIQKARNRHHNYVKNTHGIEENQENTLLNLLKERGGFGVFDPREMIFAHVGFASDGQQRELVVDYSRPWVQVHTELARYLGRTYGLPSLLEYIGDNKPSAGLDGLPTWVPDWTCFAKSNRLPNPVSSNKTFRIMKPHSGLNPKTL